MKTLILTACAAVLTSAAIARADLSAMTDDELAQTVAGSVISSANATSTAIGTGADSTANAISYTNVVDGNSSASASSSATGEGASAISSASVLTRGGATPPSAVSLGGIGAMGVEIGFVR